MDIDVHAHNDNITKIEDIIDIQKANGNFSSRQVFLNFPSNTDKTAGANLAKSLESGLYKTKSDNDTKKKFTKLRAKRQKSPTQDNVSWPSDSDITVLRMKLCVTSDELKQDSLIPGDGLHHRNSSSMVNLATLIRHSQSSSKPNINIEEYLVPLTSWERESDQYQDSDSKELNKEVETEETQTLDLASQLAEEYNIYHGVCSHGAMHFSEEDSNSEFTKIGTVSKLARFLRLYFCPCCTCLYRLEMGEEAFGCCSSTKDNHIV